MEIVNLRDLLIKGGLSLSIRQGMGMVLSLLSVLVISRVIGPKNYGLYISTINLENYIFQISNLGIGVYLIRANKVDNKLYNLAFLLLLVLSSFGALIFLFFSYVLHLWLRLQLNIILVCLILVALYFKMFSIVPLAKLEKEMRYSIIAGVELTGQIFYLIVGGVLAYSGLGALAPAGGWFAQYALSCFLLYIYSGYKPSISWNKNLAFDILKYGGGYSTSSWVWQLRNLVNPFIVGRFMGTESVALVAMAIRITEMLGFIKGVAWRMSIPLLSMLQSDVSKIVKSVMKGMQIQVIILGPILLFASLLLEPIIHIFLGNEWLNVAYIFPFVAFSFTMNSLFNLFSSALYVVRRNIEVTEFHLVHVGLFSAGSLILVRKYGIYGYGWAEIWAFLSYIVLYIHFCKNIGRPDNYTPIYWGIIFGISYYSVWIGWLAFLPILGLFIIRDSRYRLFNQIKEFANIWNPFG